MSTRQLCRKAVRRIALTAALLSLGAGCRGDGGARGSTHAAAGGHHAHGHGHGHGHGEGPAVAITRWSERYELFAEHPPAVVGKPLTLLAHLTVLDGFTPLGKGPVQLELSGPVDVRGSAKAPVRPGIFPLTVTPPKPGRYRGIVRVRSGAGGAVEGFEVRVYSTAAEAKKHAPKRRAGLIELLKEQQWRVDFATAFARRGTITPSIEVSGRVATPPGGTGEVSAPVTGRLVAPRGGLPQPGDAVREGQVLASLVPSPSSPEGGARARLAVAEAQARAEAAKTALARAEKLFSDEAISKRALEKAQREKRVAAEAVRAAGRAARLYSGAASARGRGSWKLRAPITGTLAKVQAKPGATVSPREVLFRVVDARELWITARVPEQQAARLRTDRDARYQVAGLDSWKTIHVTGEGKPHAKVTVGRTVDRRSRTVDVIYALRAPDPALRVGGLVKVSLPAGKDFSGVIVPRTALVDQQGRDVVYVQADGEHFEERPVRVGPRAGDRVAVAAGLRAGERIVTEGAHLVRLADSSRGGGGGHGHIHAHGHGHGHGHGHIH